MHGKSRGEGLLAPSAGPVRRTGHKAEPTVDNGNGAEPGEGPADHCKGQKPGRGAAAEATCFTGDATSLQSRVDKPRLELS